MTQLEYEQKKLECWEEFCGEHLFDPHNIVTQGIFGYAFDRAYALGREKETITQEDVEKAAGEYVYERQKIRHYAKRDEDATMRDFDKTIKAWDAYDMEQAFESGANLFLGKQEKKADEHKVYTCEKSKVLYHFRMAEACKIGNNPESDYWIGYSKAIQELFGLNGEPMVEPTEPTVIQGWVFVDKTTFDRHLCVRRVTQGDYEVVWDSDHPEFCLGTELYPDMVPNSLPEPVEIIIKRKKK